MNDPAQKYSLNPLFTVEPVYCAQRFTVTSSPSLDDTYLIWDADRQTFTFNKITDDTTLSGETSIDYTITVLFEVTNASGTVVDQEPISFTHTIANPCTNKNKITLTPTPQVNPPQDTYSETDLVFTYKPFTVTPSFCEITVSCDSVTPENVNMPCQELSSQGQAKWTFTPTDYTD